jgi:outer membrane protein assembly factor BamB
MRFSILLAFVAAATAFATDWIDYRGPNRDGRSDEKNLPAKWGGPEQSVWKAPYGGRSTPVIHDGRVYVLNPTHKHEDTKNRPLLQERLMALDAATGKVIWEYRYNMYHSDVPAHRIAWSSPSVDLETGNIYVFGAGGTLLAISREGKKLWERTLVEDFGVVTTHGGRTTSPVLEADKVIISAITTSWGDHARAGHRFMAFDKKTGETIYVSAPGGRPFDTTYSPPIVHDSASGRLLIAGGGDGTVHAVKVNTGEPVWKFYMSKRGVNSGVIVAGTNVIVSHSEENLDTSEMGLLAAVDLNAKGDVKKEQLRWALPGVQMGFSSPVLDGDMLMQVDNGSNVFAYDVNTGKQLWKKNLGTIQKASPVFGDGKLYVGNENGKFAILKTSKEGAEVLDLVSLPMGPDGPEEITASPAVSDGRVYVVSKEAIYCFGRKGPSTKSPPYKAPMVKPSTAEPTYVMVSPTDLAIRPGETVQLHARLFDAKGEFVREEKAATWAPVGLKGNATPDGKFTAAPADSQAGTVKATVGALSGVSRIRVLSHLPLTENFDAMPAGAPPRYWINTTTKYEVRDVEGKKYLAKLADNAATKRARSFFGMNNEHDYTIEGDVMAIEKRRQLGDAGIVAQRYQLVIFGNAQRLELQPWQPETERTVVHEFAWKKDTWYHLKLRVENMPGGKVKAQGKAWPTGEPEPAAWLVERIDPIGNREGAPGIYADAPFEVYFDNIKVTSNQ